MRRILVGVARHRRLRRYRHVPVGDGIPAQQQDGSVDVLTVYEQRGDGLLGQAHGYVGLSYRDLVADVGIKAASIYHHFAAKAELGAAVAKRYWEDIAAELTAILAEIADPVRCLRDYPGTFRRSLEDGNRLCLCSFMSAEYADLPEIVRREARGFADVDIAWLAKVLTMAGIVDVEDSQARASAIFAAVSGASSTPGAVRTSRSSTR